MQNLRCGLHQEAFPQQHYTEDIDNVCMLKSVQYQLCFLRMHFRRQLQQRLLRNSIEIGQKNHRNEASRTSRCISQVLCSAAIPSSFRCKLLRPFRENNRFVLLRMLQQLRGFRKYCVREGERAVPRAWNLLFHRKLHGAAKYRGCC